MKFTEEKLESADKMVNAKFLMVNETAVKRINN